MGAKLSRPYLLLMATVVLVGVTGFPQDSYSAPWCRWKNRHARCCCGNNPGVVAKPSLQKGCPPLPAYVREDYDHPGDTDSDPDHYVSMTGNGRWAKLLKFTTPHGFRYVAFEMDPAQPPRDQPGRRKTELSDVTKLCDFIYRGQTEVEGGERVEVLYLLHIAAP